MSPHATSGPHAEDRQSSLETTTASPTVSTRQKTAPLPPPQDADGGLIGKVVGLTLLVLGATEFTRGLLPLPWLPQVLTVLAGSMVTVVGVRLALQQRQPLLRQLAEGLTARKRLEEAQYTLLERIKRGEQFNQELTQKVAHLQQSERELNNAHTALVVQAQEDAAVLARASVALQTESVARAHLEQELHLTTTAAA